MKPTAKSVQVNTSDTFPIQSVLKEGDALLPLLFNFALAYEIRMLFNFALAYEIRSPRKSSQFVTGKHWLLDYAHDVNLLGNSINTLKENTATLLEASRNVGLEINTEKTKYMIMSHHLNSGQRQNIRIANESFENVAKFKYLGMTLANENDIHDEIKSRLNSGNASYHSVQNFLSFQLI
jgi:hypothetical protein